MAVAYICTECGLHFRVGQIRYQSQQHGQKDDLIYYIVCQQCGTEHLIHINHYYSENETYTLLGKQHPEFREVTGPEYTQCLKETQRNQTLLQATDRMPLSKVRRMVLLSSVLALPFYLVFIPVNYLYHKLRIRWMLAYGNRTGRTDIPEYDETWEVAEKAIGKVDWKSLACCHCASMDRLSNSVSVACPNCKADNTLLDIEAYDLILSNGRKVSSLFK